MMQTQLLGEDIPLAVTTEKVVNVSSVPQLSPFRYPGGKTWLVPRIRQWLKHRSKKPSGLVEPFAGGGIVSLTAVFENLVHCAVMVEKDDQVAAVWHTIFKGDGEELANQIVSFQMTPEAVSDTLSGSSDDLLGKAFRTLVKNRVCHGGILAPGSGILKYGENGKGIASRWYPETLRRRILSIQQYKDRFIFVEGDGLQIMRDHDHRDDVVFFIDPPYTASGKKAGSRLYKHSELDHKELFRVASTLAGDFLMTYDNAQGVSDMARQYGFDTLAIPMKNTHHAEMTELLISRNLDWAR